MPRKTKFSLYRCPLNKWGRYRLNEEETELLKQFVEQLPTNGKIDVQTVKALNEWVYKMTGRRLSCSTCKGAELVNWIRSEIDNLE